MSEMHLTCKDVVELLTAYLEEGLDPADRLRLERHLSYCDGCTAYLAQLRLTLRVAGSLSEEAIHPEAEERLLGAFRAWAAEKGREL